MKKVTAFSLVEVLIVISVFATGVLAVLYGMAQTLGNQDKAKTQIYSAFFAREWIELMYHLRDSNYRKKLPRNCVFNPGDPNIVNTIEMVWWTETNNPFCDGEFKPWMVLKIEMSLTGYTTVQKADSLPDTFDERFNQYQLHYVIKEMIDDNLFSYSYGWSATDPEGMRYARYITIDSVYEWDQALPIDKILKITSHVLFQKGALTGEKVIESFIGNYEI